jgi:hypothetical protein
MKTASQPISEIMACIIFSLMNFDIDTIKKENKADVNIIINNYSYQDNDSTKTEPLKSIKLVMTSIQTIHQVNRK